MKTTTVATQCMPKTTPDNTPETLPVMEEPVRVKLYEADHAQALEIQTLAKRINRTITLHEVIREAVHNGLQLTKRKYEAATEAVANTK